MKNHTVKEIEDKIINLNLRDYGKEGLKPDGTLKQGYYRSKQNKIFKLVEIFPRELVRGKEDVLYRKAQALREKGIFVKTYVYDFVKSVQGLRKGFIQLQDGNYYSITEIERKSKNSSLKIE